jgi:8-oxo-dGTP diphosphatase
MLQRTEDEGFLPGYWEFPGGGVEEGEELNAAAEREFYEECGCRIVLGKAVTSFLYYIGADLHVEIVFKATIVDGTIRLSSEHQLYAWVASDAISDHPCTLEIRQVFDKVLEEENI